MEPENNIANNTYDWSGGLHALVEVGSLMSVAFHVADLAAMLGTYLLTGTPTSVYQHTPIELISQDPVANQVLFDVFAGSASACLAMVLMTDTPTNYNKQL